MAVSTEAAGYNKIPPSPALCYTVTGNHFLCLVFIPGILTIEVRYCGI